MIINLLINFILLIVGIIFSFFPVVTIASLPVVGEALSSTLTTMVRIWNSVIETFPYAGIAWQMFIFVVIPFEAIMILMKFFLGSRALGNHNEK